MENIELAAVAICINVSCMVWRFNCIDIFHGDSFINPQQPRYNVFPPSRQMFTWRFSSVQRVGVFLVLGGGGGGVNGSYAIQIKLKLTKY